MLFILIGAALLAVAFTSPVNDPNLVKLLQYENQPLDSENQYKFHYELSDGQKRTEEGVFIPSIDNQNKRSLVVSGSYEFVAPDGQLYSVQYTADENGFHPSQPSQTSNYGFGAAISPNAIASLIG